ncbi:general odorant-binding protein 19d-like [Euwallacea similis]|uniref:general odorant-binding protein 19d-like n=1 Tax=Euwallacea similis TaxID=1736056 RepID=UPI00344F16B1
MKSIILLMCGLVCANALDQDLIDEKKGMVMEYGLECVESEKATTEDIVAMKEHKPPVTHEGRCVIFCVSKKLHMMNDDGTISQTPPKTEWLDKVKANDPEVYGNMEKVHQACIGVENKEDGCDTAYEFVHCMKTESQKYGIDKLFA